MPTLIAKPTSIQAAGNKPKLIDEYIGRVNSKTAGVSVAHMRSPQGWVEPGQTPEFDEFTVVLKGMLRMTYQGGSFNVVAGQAMVANKAPQNEMRGHLRRSFAPPDGRMRPSPRRPC